MASVAIIGAGPSGLSAARHLKDVPGIKKLTVFEAKNDIGGLWAPETTSPPENLTKKDVLEQNKLILRVIINNDSHRRRRREERQSFIDIGRLT